MECNAKRELVLREGVVLHLHCDYHLRGGTRHRMMLRPDVIILWDDID